MKSRKDNKKNNKKKNKILSETELKRQSDVKEKIEKDKLEEKTKENKRKKIVNDFIDLKRRYLPRESFHTAEEYQKMSDSYRKFVDIIAQNEGNPEKIRASSLNLKTEELAEIFTFFFVNLIAGQRRELVAEILTRYLGVDFLIPTIEANSNFRNNYTAAQLAARCGEFSMFDYILRLKKPDNSCLLNVNWKDDLGRNILNYALIILPVQPGANFSARKMKDLIDYLCDAGLDLNSQSNDGKTILHDILLEIVNKDADKCFLRDIYSYLLAKGADDTIEDYSNKKITALAVFRLLEHKPFDKEDIDEQRKKLLFKKVKKFKSNLPEIIKTLSIVGESDFSEVDNEGCNIVHYAAWHGIHEIFSDIANKNNINEVDNHKMTPVMYAARNEKKTAIFELVRLGADITKENKFGETLMHYAASKGWIDVLKLAASNKKLLLTGNNEGYLPIHKAVVYGNMEVLKYLLEIGQDINVQAHNGNTILHVAAQRGHMKIFNYLTEMGADQTIKNKSGILSGDPCPKSPIVTNLEESTEISSSSSIVVDKKQDLTLNKV